MDHGEPVRLGSAGSDGHCTLAAAAPPRRLLPPPRRTEPSRYHPPLPACRYQEGDEVHLIHVIPRLQLAATYGAPPVDFLPYQARGWRQRGARLGVPAAHLLITYHLPSTRRTPTLMSSS